jgi:hypothetical protein
MQKNDHRVRQKFAAKMEEFWSSERLQREEFQICTGRDDDDKEMDS